MIGEIKGVTGTGPEPIEATQELIDAAWNAKRPAGGHGGGTAAAPKVGLTRKQMRDNPPQGEGNRHEWFKTYCGKSAVAHRDAISSYTKDTRRAAALIDPPLDPRQVAGLTEHAWEEEQLKLTEEAAYDFETGYFRYDPAKGDLLALYKTGSGDDVVLTPRAVGGRKIVPLAVLGGQDEIGGWVVQVGTKQHRLTIDGCSTSAGWENFVAQTGLLFPAADDRNWFPVGFGGVRGRFRSWLTSLDLPTLQRTDWLGWHPELGKSGVFVASDGPLVPLGQVKPQIAPPPPHVGQDAQYGFLPGGLDELRAMLREMLLWHDPAAAVVTFSWHLAAVFRRDLPSKIFPILGIGGPSGIGKTTVFGRIHSLCAGRPSVDGITTAAAVWSAGARNSSSAVIVDDPDTQTMERLSEFFKAVPLNAGRRVKRQQAGQGWVDSEQVARAPFVIMAESLPGGRKALEDRILEVWPGQANGRLSTTHPGELQIRDLERFQNRYNSPGLGPLATGTLIQAVLDCRESWLQSRDEWTTNSSGRLRDHEIALVAGARMLQLVLGVQAVTVSDGDGTTREVDPVVVVREFCAARMATYNQMDNTLVRVVLPAWFQANEHLWESRTQSDPGRLHLTAHVRDGELWLNPSRLAEWWRDNRNNLGRWQNTDDERGLRDQLHAHRGDAGWDHRDSGTYTQKQSGGQRVKMWRLPDADLKRLAERLGVDRDGPDEGQLVL